MKSLVLGDFRWGAVLGEKDVAHLFRVNAAIAVRPKGASVRREVLDHCKHAGEVVLMGMCQA